MGDTQVDVAVERMRRKFGADVTTAVPRVSYKETITAPTKAEYKHKKQTGGHGQYGDCKIRVEPLPRGSGFEFVNEIFGGAIPKNFIPAVEKGIVESAQRGYLAGFPVVDFRVVLYDGSYHEVDSSEMAFKIAGSLAFKAAMEKARPALLEPVMNVDIEAPQEYTGDLLGDLNSRRGRIIGMDEKGGMAILHAQVPMAEMLTYQSDLTARTQGRGSFRMEMSHYDLVPTAMADRIIAHVRAERGELTQEAV
jgi:elongation factor G